MQGNFSKRLGEIENIFLDGVFINPINPNHGSSESKLTYF
jgi:hypothetical protein